MQTEALEEKVSRVDITLQYVPGISSRISLAQNADGFKIIFIRPTGGLLSALTFVYLLVLFCFSKALWCRGNWDFSS